MQLSLFDGENRAEPGCELAELFEAYFACRSNKRNTHNALAFEVDFESHLVQLWRELNSGTYQPGRSLAFIVDKPVKREIFAAPFRDRVVHHLVINKLNPLFETEFIYDSYASRAGKGTLFAVRRLERFIRSCSANYTRDAYVLKLDIRGFFMHINTTILLDRLQQFIQARYVGADRDLLIGVCAAIVFNRPSENCVIKGHRSDWIGLPTDKSLFGTPPDCGLPIGNLTSQVFANFYLNSFDHFVKHDLRVRFYGRYVDDLVLVHHDRDYLAGLIPVLSDYLDQHLGLELHPAKTRLAQHGEGVAYLGAFIMPGRVYAGKRTKGNFHTAITRHNDVVADHEPDRSEQEAFLASMNSYLGYMRQYNTRQLRGAMIGKYVTGWWTYAHLTGSCDKFVLNQRRRVSTQPRFDT